MISLQRTYLVFLIFIGSLLPIVSYAHCDTLDGPVALEAMTALDNGDVTPVLKWVKAEHEAEITKLFHEVTAARASSPNVKALADRHFLETLIRLHRAGEGAPYTGLKPAGTIEPAVAAADQAIAGQSVDALASRIAHAAEHAIQQRFTRLMQANKHKDESVTAGREYVAAYVEYVHFVEGLHNMIAAEAAHHDH